MEFLGSTIVVNKARTPLDEIASISVRIFLIILIELGIAWLFKFRQKNQIRFIAVFNIATQLIYSILLLAIEYKLGKLYFVILSFVFMLFIIIIKSIFYLIYLKKKSAEKVSAWRIIPCAFITSFVSWYIGIRVALYITSL